MTLLLDTHALLWWLNDDARLGPGARGMIADPANRVLVSAVSLWEIAVKVRVGKLDADVDAVVRAAAVDFTILQVSPAHLTALMRLPLFVDHRDPFDHLLIAQAGAEGARFISEDRNVPRYSVDFMTCSDQRSSTGVSGP